MVSRSWRCQFGGLGKCQRSNDIDSPALPTRGIDAGHASRDRSSWNLRSRGYRDTMEVGYLEGFRRNLFAPVACQVGPTPTRFRYRSQIRFYSRKLEKFSRDVCL